MDDLAEFLRETAYDNPASVAAKLNEAADRLILYREVLERVALLGKNAEEGHLADDEAWAMMAREVSALLSRSGDD